LLRGARVVHLHNPPDTLFPLAAFARALGRRVVYDQHDLAPELFRVKFGDSPLVWLVGLMERATFRLAHVVLLPNESYRAVALQRGGVPAGRLYVVRNGPPAAAVVHSHNGPGEVLRDPHLVFLGSMERQDGIDLLPRLLSDLRDRHGLQETRLTMVGDGSRRPALERAFANAGLSGRVRFTGWVAHGDVPQLLAEADICLDPAEANELNHRSTMVKIAEYMAAGKPIVAHRLVETERTAGPAAVYAREGDPDDLAAQVAHLARSPELRERLGTLGLERARELTWDRSEAVLLEAYGRLPRPSGGSLGVAGRAARPTEVPSRAGRW
jgi:glycosyltransferase involved in cell wall biosynthesis